MSETASKKGLAPGPDIVQRLPFGKPQGFTVSHLNEADFKADGLRPYSVYRDLGIAAATNGLVQAQVIRMTQPFDAALSKKHHHNVAFQMVYCLKGWFTSEFEGYGTHTLKAGSSWIQPPGVKHTVRDWSEDCELLEIMLPAEPETVEDE